MRKKAAEIISSGQKPSARKVARETGIPEQDVHRCLNILESRGSVETYTRKMLGEKHRMIGVKR